MMSTTGGGAERRRFASPLRVALAYVAISGGWLVASHAWLPISHHTEQVLEMIGGLGFVFVTGTALFLMLHRQYRNLDEAAARVELANALLAEYAAFPQLSPHPIVALDSEGEVTWANPAARDQSANESAATLLPQDLAGVIDRCVETGPVEDIRHLVNGKKWEWSFFPDAERRRIYGYGTDRTHEERLEAQIARTARMESVGRLASGLSHDFNNVLTAINGLSELLAADLPPGDVHAADVAEIRDAANLGAALVRKLMLLGRERPAEQHAVDLNLEIRQLLPLLRHLLPAGVTLAFQQSEGAAIVLFNSGELEQVLMNLVSNAGDAMPGGGAVTISTSATVTEGVKRLVISVADTGSGIPPEILEDIFDPFFTTKPTGKGTGLGLASVYSIITAHGGTVEVDNCSPGAVFRLSLPPA